MNVMEDGDPGFEYFRKYTSRLEGQSLWSLVKSRILKTLPFSVIFASKVSEKESHCRIYEAALILESLLRDLEDVMKECAREPGEGDEGAFFLPESVNRALGFKEGSLWVEIADAESLSKWKEDGEASSLRTTTASFHEHLDPLSPLLFQEEEGSIPSLDMNLIKEEVEEDDLNEGLPGREEEWWVEKEMCEEMKGERRSEVPWNVCPYCEESFERLTNFNAHLKTCRRNHHQLGLQRPKTCPKCNKKFASTKYLVYRHLKSCGGGSNSHSDDISASVGVTVFKCNKCDKEYKTFCHYVHHVNFCGTPDGEKKEAFFWKTKNVCNKCGKVFNSLEEKKNSHHFCNPEKHFKCPKCDYESYYPRHVKDHYEIKHREERRFCCHTCGKTFAYKTALKTHLKIHAERRHVCSECGKKFVHKTTLDLHMTVHFKKEIPCEKCGKIFPNSTYLNRHMNSQHPSDGIFQKFQCPYCPGAFREKKYTKKHVKIKHPGMSTEF